MMELLLANISLGGRRPGDGGAGCRRDRGEAAAAEGRCAHSGTAKRRAFQPRRGADHPASARGGEGRTAGGDRRHGSIWVR